MRPQRVQVFGLGEPSKSTPKEKRRYVVRWRVDGRDFKRRRKVKAEAERYRSKLIGCIADGVPFDPTTGEPVTWVSDEVVTWWSWAREWLLLKWPGWAGTSRKSGVEALVAFTPYLVQDRAPEPPAGLQQWLWEVGFNPATEPAGPCCEWLQRWSVPLDEISPGLLERALTAGTTKLDGNPMAPSVTKRRRDLLNAALKAAVRRERLRSNPMERTEWTVPRLATAVDVTVLPSMDDVDLILEEVRERSRFGARYAAFFACMAYAGLRPSEAAGLLVADVELPDEGWGVALLRGAEPVPGHRYSGNDTSRQRKALKHRPAGTVRRVPIPPALVRMLTAHLDTWPAVDGRVFSNAAGNSVTAENYGKVWNRAKPKAWGEHHPALGAVPYDLRHTAATVMIQAGVPLAEIARRLGHSIDVLLRVYAGLFNDDEERANEAIDSLLA